jgi:HTH-type transcriptional regulator/antitoxin HigA
MVESRIRPIRSEPDYEAALARVEALMEIVRSEPEDDEFDVLTTLIELYEDQHVPMDLPDPVEAIRFRMEQLGKT